MPSSVRGRRSQAVAKRLLDITISAAALVLLSPILLALAVAVRLRLGSPVIYRQQRPGLHGKPFTICKFRTMVDTRDAAGTLLPSIHRTPPFGYRLRALSLDELPELWNVLKGDMSLVGPRPLMMSYLPRYNVDQARRHDVRPGITGLAQIGGRNAISWEDKFRLDLAYVDHHDLAMDVSIIMRTARAVLSREGIRYGDGVDMPEFLGTDAPDAPAQAAL
jgi:sugar transferase EpsL